MTKFEEAFIQCLKDQVYPGPANINERRGHGRFNRLNGKCTTKRLELMYAFGVPYVRGHTAYRYDGSGGTIITRDRNEIPEWPYIALDDKDVPEVGYRKHEIQDPNKPWLLKSK